MQCPFNTLVESPVTRQCVCFLIEVEFLVCWNRILSLQELPALYLGSSWVWLICCWLWNLILKWFIAYVLGQSQVCHPGQWFYILMMPKSTFTKRVHFDNFQCVFLYRAYFLTVTTSLSSYVSRWSFNSLLRIYPVVLGYLESWLNKLLLLLADSL
jgi:hypothetical protein